MAVLAEPEQGEIEQRPRGIQTILAVEALERRLVGCRSFLRGHALGRNRVDILARHRRDRQQRLVDHAEIAVGMVGRNEALVAPEPMHVVPRKPRHERRHGEHLIEPPRRRATRQTYGAGAAARFHDAEHPLPDPSRQRLVFFEMARPPARSTLFPYTPLFRSPTETASRAAAL